MPAMYDLDTGAEVRSPNAAQSFVEMQQKLPSVTNQSQSGTSNTTGNTYGRSTGSQTGKTTSSGSSTTTGKTTTAGESTTTGGSETQSKQYSLNTTPEILDALNKFIEEMSAGGTVDQRTVSAERQKEIQRDREQQSNFTPEAAKATAERLSSYFTRILTEQQLPGILRAAEGAGASKGTTRALLTQQAIARTAEVAAKTGADLSTSFGGLSNQLANVLEQLTRQDPNSIANQLLQAIAASKGIVTDVTGNSSTNNSSKTVSNQVADTFQKTLNEQLTDTGQVNVTTQTGNTTQNQTTTGETKGTTTGGETNTSRQYVQPSNLTAGAVKDANNVAEPKYIIGSSTPSVFGGDLFAHDPYTDPNLFKSTDYHSEAEF